MKLLPISILSLALIGHMLSAMNKFEQLPSKEIVERLITKKETEIKEAQKEYGASSLKSPFASSSTSLYRQFYPTYEQAITNKPDQFPTYPVTGGINYLMSLEQIKKIIIKKFQQLYQDNKIIDKKTFAQMNQKLWFFKGNSLTRIWGAEYLTKKFKENSRNTMKVPEYIIVTDDLNAIKIDIFLGTGFPILATIENGTIYAEKIEGTEIAKKGSNIVGYGYTDYSSPGNIIQTQEGNYYIVDTEYKSFYDGLPETVWLKNDLGGPRILSEYLYNRFKLLNNISGINIPFEFSVKN